MQIMSETLDFSWKLGVPTIVPDLTNCPAHPWFPDAHISVARHPVEKNRFRLIIATAHNYYTLGSTPFPEDHTYRENQDPILDNTCEAPCWHCGGTWLMGVFPHGDCLVGFVHGEDHFKDLCKGACGWKSVGVCYSYDKGWSWTKPERIITSPLARPKEPEFGGCGDCCVVKKDGQYYVFYSGGDLVYSFGIRMAVSSDPMGRPGTWTKWFEDSFSQPGLGGREGDIKELGELGANPSVTWNTYLGRWLMTWHGWTPADVLLSSSTDLLHWTPAVRLLAEPGWRCLYPTIIGAEGDQECGQQARIYYTHEKDKTFEERRCLGRDIVFFKPGEPEHYTPSPYCSPDYKPRPLNDVGPIHYPQLEHPHGDGHLHLPGVCKNSGQGMQEPHGGVPQQQSTGQMGLLRLLRGCFQMAAACCASPSSKG